jgi:hypothetical protein
MFSRGLDPSANVIKPLRFRFSSLFLAFTRRMIGSVDESAMNFGPGQNRRDAMQTKLSNTLRGLTTP